MEVILVADSHLISSFRIGPARPDELDTICEIAKIAWEPIHETMIDALGEDVHQALSGDDWRDRKADQIRCQFTDQPDWILAIREGSKVVGFVTFVFDRSISVGTIRNNAVHPDYQGKGIATEMYSHVLGLFKKAGMSFARVGTGGDLGHAPARRAYEKAGFDLRREDVIYYKVLE